MAGGIVLIIIGLLLAWLVYRLYEGKTIRSGLTINDVEYVGTYSTVVDKNIFHDQCLLVFTYPEDKNNHKGDLTVSPYYYDRINIGDKFPVYYGLNDPNNIMSAVGGGIMPLMIIYLAIFSVLLFSFGVYFILQSFSINLYSYLPQFFYEVNWSGIITNISITVFLAVLAYDMLGKRLLKARIIKKKNYTEIKGEYYIEEIGVVCKKEMSWGKYKVHINYPKDMYFYSGTFDVHRFEYTQLNIGDKIPIYCGVENRRLWHPAHLIEIKRKHHARVVNTKEIVHI